MWEEEEEEKRKQTVPYAEPKSEYFWKTATNHIIIRAETHGLLEKWGFVSAELVFCEFSEQTQSRHVLPTQRFRFPAGVRPFGLGLVRTAAGSSFSTNGFPL